MIISREPYIKAKEQGDIKSNINIDMLSAVIDFAANLNNNTALTAKYKDHNEMYEDIFNFIFYGIIKTGENKNKFEYTKENP